MRQVRDMIGPLVVFLAASSLVGGACSGPRGSAKGVTRARDTEREAETSEDQETKDKKRRAASEYDGSKAGKEAPERRQQKDSRGAGSLRLVVLVVIDQLPSWSFKKRLPLFKYGIRRLVDGGAYYEDVRYPYATTLTAVGHAALATGTAPALSGIVGNSWYRPSLKRYGTSVFDPRHRLFSMAPNSKGHKPGASPRWLRADTVGDSLKRHTEGKGRVVSVSLKDRAAVLPGGKKGDLAVFYSRRIRPVSMTTSSFYRRALPKWVKALNTRLQIHKKLAYVWRPLDRKLLAQHAGRDDAPGEPRGYDLGATFPHDLSRSSRPRKAIRETPFGDTVVVETAIAALDGEQLGQDSIPDFLSVSFSTPDKVGHRWGQGSWEMLDTLLRLDRKIGRLLQALDKKVGKGRYALVLTSDHGSPPMPTRTLEPTKKRSKKGSRTAKLPSYRIPMSNILSAARRAALKTAGRGRWVQGVAHPFVTLTKAAHALPAKKKQRMLSAIVKALLKIRGMGNAYIAKKIAGDCSKRKGLQRAFCLSVNPAVAGDVIYGTKPNFFPSGDKHEAQSHGSPHRYDQQVPLVIYSPTHAPSKPSKQVSALSIAPTLTHLLGVPKPHHATSPPLP